VLISFDPVMTLLKKIKYSNNPQDKKSKKERKKGKGGNEKGAGKSL
jgi:hypothetical protein